MSSINIGLFVVIYNEYHMLPENVYSERRCLSIRFKLPVPVCDLRAPPQCD